MKQRFKPIVVLSFFALFVSVLSTFAAAQSTQVINLSGDGWRAMLDPKAEWKGDKIYLPSELPALSTLPINVPTEGWGALSEDALAVSVPMTIDEYFLEGVNTKTYEGVSWVWRTFKAPADIQDKVILLDIAKARMRAEVYINRKLAAYDIVGETPFQFDVSEFIIPNAKNEIAVRLTNPGGRRGWYDISNLYWGEKCYASNGRNFSTLGDVTLSVKPEVYVNDIFVKNLLPAEGRSVAVSVEVVNKANEARNVVMPFVVTCDATGKRIASHSEKVELKQGVNHLSFEMKLSKAKLWSPASPNLYNMTSKLGSDTKSVRFGVRTFEVKKGLSGGDNYYLNGKRFIFRSAIDWGFYTPTGDYATAELAEKSVDAALAMKQNGLSFHRTIGEPLVMKYADEKGLCIYEEPGGFHYIKGTNHLDTVSFTSIHVKEKIRRMVIRDRNHPSLIIYSLSNEDSNFPLARKEALEMINSMDDSRLIVNTSGPLDDRIQIQHFRPYQSVMRMDNYDDHTAKNQSPIYQDIEFYQKEHRNDTITNGTYFLGEVNSVSGPINWVKTYKDIKATGKVGYDTNIYKGNHDKLVDAFSRFNLESGSGNIKSPEDISMQAGRGMMYAHARHAQSVLCNNIAEGYALNGWSPGPQSEGSALDWSSAIVDEGRNIKGPADVFTYWTRLLQISLSRKNGKYFRVGDEVVMEANIINHGYLPVGEYTLRYTIDNTDFEKSFKVNIEGGDCFAQSLDDISFTTQPQWEAGYVTLRAQLLRSGKEVANGSEQILLQNRPTYKEALSKLKIEVTQWDEAA
ncbi:MAG: glycoside hydrolase family 2 TIM barrel-domain containing protein, partial [Rikenellaceae bacterium]